MRIMSVRSYATFLCLALASCVYADVKTPLSYRSPTPGDVRDPLGPEASGESCSHLVLWMVAWGDGGYAAAVANARAQSGARALADVQADRSLFNVLSVYQRACTRVRGRTVL